MSFTPQPLPEIQIPLNGREIVQHGWDGFGTIIMAMVEQTPVWVRLIAVVLFVLFARHLVPVLLRWLWRYLTRSSLLG